MMYCTTDETTCGVTYIHDFASSINRRIDGKTTWCPVLTEIDTHPKEAIKQANGLVDAIHDCIMDHERGRGGLENGPMHYALHWGGSDSDEEEVTDKYFVRALRKRGWQVFTLGESRMQGYNLRMAISAPRRLSGPLHGSKAIIPMAYPKGMKKLQPFRFVDYYDEDDERSRDEEW